MVLRSNSAVSNSALTTMCSRSGEPARPVPGVDHALLDDLGRVLAAAAQALQQFLPRRRRMKISTAAGKIWLDLQRALEVDLSTTSSPACRRRSMAAREVP